ncbi:MAG: MarR family winged helix-turn-helix transcriptional regulator [Actinomycetota bacterium]|nr:MarR family winged helix-turn-helix transcriptional regulator [Actinomycetota bacterium]
MVPVLNFTCADRSINLFVRSTRTGPESELTAEFVDKTLPTLKNRKRHYALFAEPQLDTGFPDIVIVAYNPRVLDQWTNERKNLTLVDLKILHHLYFVGGADSESIEKILGVDSKSLVRSLERLLGSSLIRWHGKKWTPRTLKSRYAVRSIVAIEAKMKNWASAFQQAEMNRWFASESYVLLPMSSPQKQILEKSRDKGVGIYSMPSGSNIKKLCPSKYGQLPSSYASWLFNEWIGRRLHT